MLSESPIHFFFLSEQCVLRIFLTKQIQDTSHEKKCQYT